MRFPRKLASLVFVAALVLAVFAVLGSAAAAPAGSSTLPDLASGVSAPRRSLPFSANARYIDPGLEGATGRLGVLVALDASASVADVAGLLQAARAVPTLGGIQLVRGFVDADKIDELRSLPSVLAILKDRPIEYDGPAKPKLEPRVPIQFDGLTLPDRRSTAREPLLGAPEVTMREVVNFTGARRAWTDLGVDGTGVTIAIVDTGVDHGAFNLGPSSIARNAAGWPISFDPDGSTLGWTLEVLTSYTVGNDTFLPTAGLDPLIYVFFPGGGPAAFLWSDFFGDVFPFPFLGPNPGDMNITGLPASMSGNYSFGILFEWNYAIDFFPAVLIDSVTPGVYDTAYLDLSFDYWLYFGATPQPDFSFADETALKPAGGNVLAAADYNADGYPDISAGSLAYGLDVWGLNPNPPGFTILEPLDPAGTYLTMVYDPFGHGTSVAASAAGRESSDPLAGPGIAPGARIMGVPIFMWFDIIEGWLWAAGFDLVGQTDPTTVPNYGVVYGEWTYTGNHKADIISNSWGSSDWVTFPWIMGWPWYDVLTVVEDALMTPGYLDPAYPGTVMVHAGGNGAAGYGTVTEPGFSNLAITAGASTSLNFTALPFPGFHGDVMSWSARGPNALGAPKPDVLQVGAWAFTSAPVWAGFGNGSNAVTLFGGTSQATPLTSGSAALVIDAYVTAQGTRPSPFVVKSILKSTATDLGYDPFTQGAGHVDVYNAASLGLQLGGVTTTTPATWNNIRPRIANAWATAAEYYPDQITANAPPGPIDDTSWFAGSVRPGALTTATFKTAPATGSVSGTISAVWHNRIGSVAFNNTTGFIGAAWLGGYGYLWPLAGPIPAGTDLMVVRGVMPYDYFDSDANYIADNRSRIIVLDWVDANNDTAIDPDEVSVFNYGYNWGTTTEARVGMPEGRFAGTPVLWFSHVPLTGVFVPMPFEIQVEFYDRMPWSWVTVPGLFTASAATPATWTASLTVPAGANPGVYEGQIIVAPASGSPTAIPVSVIVPRVFSGSTLSAPLTSTGSTQIYDSSSVNGYFDWAWRYESGDWKLWFVDIADPNVISMQVDVSWEGARTDVDIVSIRPNGLLGDSSFSPYLGSGRFIWSTRTGTTEDWVRVNVVSGLDAPAPGLYTVMAHNVLLEGFGGAVPEPVTGTASVAKLAPRGPVTVVTQPGKTLSLPFQLSTGFDLTDVFFGAVPFLSTFPALTSPGTLTPLVAAGESLDFTATISVPSTTADGTYANYFALQADQLPFDPPVLVRVNVIVDSTAPAVTVVSPEANAYVRGTIPVEAAVMELNGVDTVTFTAGAGSGTMTQDPATGLWTGTWNTAGTADGTVNITVTATDDAGNARSATESVVLDNTPPTVAFSSPPANTLVDGTITVQFTSSDANPGTLVLSAGGSDMNVTGQTSASVDTRALGDGTRILTLTARDRAGNVATTTLSLNVDNTAPVVAISSPAAEAELSGDATISWSVTDANPGTVQLFIDGVPRAVTGTSYTWDTTEASDGNHTIVVRAIDAAGNAGQASVSVTTNNVDEARIMGTATATGLGIGAVVAGVVGFLAGWFIGRRRKPEEPKPGEGAPPSRPPQEGLPPELPPEDL